MRKRQRRLLVYAAAVTTALVVAACQTGGAGELAERIGQAVGTEKAGSTDGGAVSPERAEATLAEVFGPLDQQVAVGEGYAVLSPLHSGKREVGYLLPSGKSWKVAGRETVADPDGNAALSLSGELVVVKTTREKAPQFTAFRAGADGLQPADYYAAVAPAPAVKEGPFLLVNKELNVLWHYEDGKLVKAYRVGTGRQTEGPAPTWQDYRTNFFTPEGTFKVTGFVLNPPYHALKPGDQSYAGGAPGNPLGTRWMGFSVLEGDGAGIWGIHGTSEPERIGTWVSDGCIRLRTEQVEELYDQVAGRNPTLQIVSQ